MAQTLIENGQTGLIARTAINENFEETFLLNTVNVNKLAHLPTPAGGFIQLAANTRYNFGVEVDIGVNKIMLGDSCSITTHSPFLPALKSDTTDALINGNNVNFYIKDAGLRCDNGSFFDVTNTLGNTKIGLLHTVIFTGGVDFGVFDDLLSLVITNCNAIELTGRGLRTLGLDWTILNLDRFFIVSSGATFKGVDLGSATFATVEMKDVISVPTNAAGIGLSGLANSGNIANGNIATAIDCELGGVGAALENITKKDIKWSFERTTNVKDSRTLGAMEQIGNVLTTTLVTSSYVNYSGVFSESSEIERAEVVSSQLKMLVAGSGIAMISFDGTKVGGGTDAIVEAGLFKNNSIASTITRKFQAISSEISINFQVPVDFNENDVYDIRLKRISGTTNWLAGNTTLIIA